jgi:LacI family transcriptional regulator
LEKAPNFVISLKNRLIFVEVKARLRYIEVAKTIKCPVLPNKPPFGIIDARKRFRFSRAKLLERRTVMISIRDIAKECGVSVATVSKALNGHHDISAQTRETVCRKAAEMGYQPNSAARALKTNRTYNLGVLYEDPQHSGLGHEYFSRILESFRAQAEACGYDVTFINRNVGKRRSSYLEHCRYRGVDGVIAACIKFDDPEVIELANSNLPIVTVDHVFNNRAAVLSDNTDGVHKLVDQLAALGHERIAYIHGENHSAVTQKRLVGFYRACAAHGITVPDAYIVPSTYRDAKSCAAATRQLLALPQRPTAILFPDDFSAIGGIQTIREEGLLIPRDISVAGYDGNLISQIMSPQLTTYRQDTEALGRAAAELLIEQIESPRTALPEQKLVSGSLLKGQSVDVPNP